MDELRFGDIVEDRSSHRIGLVVLAKSPQMDTILPILGFSAPELSTAILNGGVWYATRGLWERVNDDVR